MIFHLLTKTQYFKKLIRKFKIIINHNFISSFMGRKRIAEKEQMIKTLYLHYNKGHSLVQTQKDTGYAKNTVSDYFKQWEKEKIAKIKSQLDVDFDMIQRLAKEEAIGKYETRITELEGIQKELKKQVDEADNPSLLLLDKLRVTILTISELDEKIVLLKITPTYNQKVTLDVKQILQEEKLKTENTLGDKLCN